MGWGNPIGRGVLAAAAMLWMPSASATMIITADTGGPISHYEQRYAMLRATGEYVVIDGRCFSACTMLLAYVPRERVCVTPRARLGFHAAWFPDMTGGRVISRQHTQRLHDSYPAPVRHWLARRGGLSSQMLVLQGRELQAILPPCRLVAGTQNGIVRTGHNLEMSAFGKGLGRRM